MLPRYAIKFWSLRNAYRRPVLFRSLKRRSVRWVPRKAVNPSNGLWSTTLMCTKTFTCLAEKSRAESQISVMQGMLLRPQPVHKDSQKWPWRLSPGGACHFFNSRRRSQFWIDLGLTSKVGDSFSSSLQLCDRRGGVPGGVRYADGCISDRDDPNPNSEKWK